jgi:ribosomal protein L29
MQRGIGQTPSPHLFGNVRKQIARVKTILTEREGLSS